MTRMVVTITETETHRGELTSGRVVSEASGEALNPKGIEKCRMHRHNLCVRLQ